MRVRTKVRSGGIQLQHNPKKAGVKVRSAVRAGNGDPGRLASNHNAKKAGVKIRSAVRAGAGYANHNARRAK